MAAMEEVAKRVAAAGGYMKISMRELREAHGTLKLGRGVVQEIHKEMTAVGLEHCGHPGSDLPTSQGASVWVYSQNSPVADLIEAVRDTDGAEKTIQQIRDLVGA